MWWALCAAVCLVGCVAGSVWIQPEEPLSTVISNHKSYSNWTPPKRKVPTTTTTRPQQIHGYIKNPVSKTKPITDVLGERLKTPEVVKSSTLKVLDHPQLATKIVHNKLIVIQKRAHQPASPSKWTQEPVKGSNDPWSNSPTKWTEPDKQNVDSWYDNPSKWGEPVKGNTDPSKWGEPVKGSTDSWSNSPSKWGEPVKGSTDTWSNNPSKWGEPVKGSTDSWSNNPSKWGEPVKGSTDSWSNSPSKWGQQPVKGSADPLTQSPSNWAKPVMATSGQAVGGGQQLGGSQTVFSNLPPFFSSLLMPLLSRPITPSALNSGMKGIKAMQGFLRNSLMGAMFCFLPSAFIALSLSATQRSEVRKIPEMDNMKMYCKTCLDNLKKIRKALGYKDAKWMKEEPS